MELDNKQRERPFFGQAHVHKEKIDNIVDCLTQISLFEGLRS